MRPIAQEMIRCTHSVSIHASVKDATVVMADAGVQKFVSIHASVKDAT